MVLIGLSCAWLLGIWLGSQYDLPWLYSLVGIAPLLLVFFVRRHRKLIVLVSLAIIILPLGASFSYSNQNVFDDGNLRFYNDRGSW